MRKEALQAPVVVQKKALAVMHLAPKSKILLVIAGPTAVGKTAIAIETALRLGTSIISADSRQCYLGMSIGTAQPSGSELDKVSHYFINSLPVTQHITAADYERMALLYLEEIYKQHDVAIVCGGTGLYIKGLCEGLDEMPKIDPVVTQQVERAYKEKGLEYLQASIASEDPEFYNAGEMQNPARLLRALTFIRTTGKSILSFRKGQQKDRPFQIIKIGLELPREALYARINKRVDEMIKAGFLKEAEELYPQRHLKNLQTVGYAELFQYLDGKLTLDEAILLIKQHTRNYAKRQMTWFRKDKEVAWLSADDPVVVDKILGLLPKA